MDQPPTTGQPTFNCPKCGYAVDVGTPTCGNCGTQVGSYDPTSAEDGYTPIPTVVTTGTPFASGGGFPKGLVILIVFAVIGFIAWRVTGAVGDFVRDTTSSFDELSGALDPVDVPPVEKVESPYKGVRELALALNEGGLNCKQIKVDHQDEYVATGSCQVPGKRIPLTHVQINIFFQRTSLDAVEEQMKQDVFNWVHDANWFVITLKPTARKVHDILGGQLSLAK